MLLLDAVLAIFLIGFLIGYGASGRILDHHRAMAHAILLASVPPKSE